MKRRYRGKRRASPVRTDVLAALEEQRRKHAAEHERVSPPSDVATESVQGDVHAPRGMPGYVFDAATNRYYRKLKPTQDVSTVIQRIAAPPPSSRQVEGEQSRGNRACETPARPSSFTSTLSLLLQRSIGGMSNTAVVTCRRDMRLAHLRAHAISESSPDSTHAFVSVSGDGALLASVRGCTITITCVVADTSDDCGRARVGNGHKVTLPVRDCFPIAAVAFLGDDGDTQTIPGSIVYRFVVVFMEHAGTSRLIATYRVVVRSSCVVACHRLSFRVLPHKDVWCLAVSPFTQNGNSVVAVAGSAHRKSASGCIMDGNDTLAITASWYANSDVFSVAFSSLTPRALVYGCRSGCVGVVDDRTPLGLPVTHLDDPVTYLHCLRGSHSVLAATTGKTAALYDSRSWQRGPYMSFTGYHNSYKRLPVVVDRTHSGVLLAACPDSGVCGTRVHAWDVVTGHKLPFRVEPLLPSSESIISMAAWTRAGTLSIACETTSASWLLS